MSCCHTFIEHHYSSVFWLLAEDVQFLACPELNLLCGRSQDVCRKFVFQGVGRSEYVCVPHQLIARLCMNWYGLHVSSYCFRNI